MNKALVASQRLSTHGAQANKNQQFYEDVPLKDRKRKRGDVESKTTRKD
jgi:hypothetical protein